MSLILDALKRAERERAAERSSALADVPAPAGNRAPPHRRWRIVAVTVLLVAVIAVALTLVRQRAPSTPQTGTLVQPRAEPPAAPSPAVPTPQATAPGVVPMPAPPAAVVPGTESVASLDDLTREEPEPLLPVAEDAAEPQPAPAPAPTPATQATEPSTAPGVPGAGEQQREIPPALTQPAPLRKFREMPPDFRADFPALNVEVHNYERAQSARFVLVNGRRYREGERLAEGPHIVEIVREGIVLEYRGEKLLFTLGR